MRSANRACRPGAFGRGARAAVRLAMGLVFASALAGCPAAEDASTDADGFKMLVQPSKPAKAAPAMPDPSIWETPLADAELDRGRRVWAGTCIQCHSTGLGGAPLIGNRELWGPRVEQGLDTLVQHATNGFYGKKGEMPARGGNAALSDEEIRLAVRFMISRIDS